MATHSSIFAWEIPWTEEPDGLQSMELKESDTTEGLSTRIFDHCVVKEFPPPFFFSFLFYFSPFIPKYTAPEHFFNTDAISLPSGPADEQQSYNQTIGN